MSKESLCLCFTSDEKQLEESGILKTFLAHLRK